MAAPVVTVDGPSGVGKGTLCRWLASQLGAWHVLDSGALYRLTGLAAIRRGIDLTTPPLDSERLAQVADSLDVEFYALDGEPGILLDGVVVGDRLYTETTGRAASVVATLPAVRTALLERQRRFRREPGLIADGRDMGTVVFPDAPVKIFLWASVEERAARRYKQLNEKGMSASLSALAQNIAERDQRDSTRAVAPLVPAEDARVIDTTGMSIETVRQTVLALINENLF